MGGQGNSPIYVIANCFKYLSSLGLDDAGLLLVTSIKGQVDKIFWVVNHLLSLILSGFDEIEANVKDDVSLEPEINFLQTLLHGRDRDQLESLDNKILEPLLLQNLLKIRSSAENDERLDQDRNKLGDADENLMLLLLDQAFTNF